MKLRLPRTLFRALVACFAPFVTMGLAPVASAAYLHSSPSLQVYTDVAEGRGIYRFGGAASLISYQNGEPTYQLTYTPSFTSSCDAGYFTLVNNGSFQLTVGHNGIMADETFSARYVGAYAQKYSGVGIRSVDNFSSGRDGYAETENAYMPTGADYRVERLTRLVTDATSSAYCTDTTLLSNLTGTLMYRVGSGTCSVYDAAGNSSSVSYGGLTAGVAEITSSQVSNNVYTYGFGFSNSDYATCPEETPLPSASAEGDSGSPVYIYNTATQQFELVGFTRDGINANSTTRYNPVATEATIDYLREEISTGTGGETIYIEGAKAREGDAAITDSSTDTTYTAILHKGQVTQGEQVLSTYNGVALDVFTSGTWRAMSEEQYNSNTWYTYADSELINVRNDASAAEDFGMKDLYYTSSLQFLAQTGSQAIELKDNVDLGAGYVQFSLAEGQSSATFEFGRESSGNSLSTSGFIVDKGVTLNNYLTYGAGRELRRVGEGVMNMVGTGDNNVLLNIGGRGLTYLNRTGGYAAYNVFVGSGATLRLADIGQVKHNVTLGAGGGTLDLNGNHYNWSAAEGNADGHFSLTVYEGLDRVETAAIANLKEGTVSTLTISRAGDFEFAGAFRDGSTYTQGSTIEMDSRYTMMPSELISAYTQHGAGDLHKSSSALQVVYNGGGTMTMTGVYTILAGSADGQKSGLTVANGRVLLQGTNTIHSLADGSVRRSNEADWHFAMAEMDVQVNSGATFELGHHALLLGDVNVASGSSYVMKQAVNAGEEFVEGWYYAEDMSGLAAYYGHKGDVKLASGASMAVRFDEGVSTSLTYAGNISGEGSLTVDIGKGRLQLEGVNTFSGDKTVESGTVRTAAGAEGDTTSHKWLVKEGATLTLDAIASAEDAARLVDAASAGLLALSRNVSGQVAISGLAIGAAEGESVHYGNSAASLQAVNNRWTLGGGGGTLYVDFLLEGDNKLVLGTAGSEGSVVLTHEGNSFTGGIEFAGKVTLGYTSVGALGNNVLTVRYGNVLHAPDTALLTASKLDTASDGVFTLSGETGAVDLSRNGALSLGAKGEATVSGPLTVAEGAAYRLGGSGELTIGTSLSGAHGIVVDGQGTSGSRVVLAAASGDTGAVVVQGYEAGKASSGEVTLSFTTDNALEDASSITVKSGGIVDLNGTNQSLSNLSGDASGSLVDTVGGNTLTLNNGGNSSYAGNMQLSGTEVVKTGTGTLAFSGSNDWKSLSIRSGVVQVAEGKALGSSTPGDVNVSAGGQLHVTAATSFDNTLNIAGYGVDGASVALRADGHLNNAQGTLNVVGNAALSGQFSFGQVNLQGHELSLKGSGVSLSAANIAGEGGKLIADGSALTGLSAGDYGLKLANGGSLRLQEGYSGGSGVALELDKGTLYVDNARFDGSLSVGVAGGTIENTWNGNYGEVLTLAGKLSGSSAESMLKLVAYKHTINLSGGADYAGRMEVGNGVTLRVTKDASVGALLNQSEVGDTSYVVVDGAQLTLTGSGNNFGSNGNPGELQLTNGGRLQLVGLAGGASMGSLGSLDMGTNGVLSLSSFADYAGNALMHIGTLDGTGRLLFDASDISSLGTGTYRLLTSDSDLTWLTQNSNLTGSTRMTLSATAVGENSYALDLSVNATSAHVTWQGSGTLANGTIDAEHITSDIGDHSFQAMDSLTLAATGTNVLTLSGVVDAASVTFTGTGYMYITGGRFADGTGLVMDGEGTGALILRNESAVFNGSLEMKGGTLWEKRAHLDDLSDISVTGNAELDIDDGGTLSTSINIAEGATLNVATMNAYTPTSFEGNLSGSGTLAKIYYNQLNLVGSHAAFTGDIEVQGGSLWLGGGADDAFSLGASSISVGRSTSLALNAAHLELGMDMNWGPYAQLLLKEGSGNSTLSGTQTLEGEWTITGMSGKQLHISGDVVGKAGSLQLFGEVTGSPFSLILSGNNSYAGGTGLNSAGSITYAASKGAFGTGAINLNAGTLSWQGVGQEGWNGDLTASGIVLGGGVLDTNGQNVTYSGAISGSGKLIKQGLGTLTLTGSLGHTGGTDIQAGTLAYDAGAADGTVALGSITGAGTFALVGGTAGANLQDNLKVGKILIDGGSLVFDHADAVAEGHTIDIVGSDSSLVLKKWSNLNASAVTLREGGTIYTGENGFGNSGGTVYVDGAGTIKAGNAGNGDIAAAISGSGTLSVLDWNGTSRANVAGTISDAAGSKLALELNHNNLHISGNNSYSGGTTITGGKVTTEHAHAFGSGGITLTGGTLAAETALDVSSSLSFTGKDTMKVTGTLSFSTAETNKIVYADAASGAAVVEADIANSTNRMGIMVASADKGNDFVELTLSGTIGTTGTSFGIDKRGDGTLKLEGTNKFAWGFQLHEGRVIAAAEQAFGTGSLDVKGGTTLEIAKDTYVNLSHYLRMEDNAELLLHSLKTDDAAVAANGNWGHVNNITLTLAGDVELTSGSTYMVISGVDDGIAANGITVNYLGDGRYTFGTSAASNTLYLTATQDANTTLVWDGTAANATWDQSAQNTNWNRADAGATDTSFMNQDSVSFTEEAGNKKVTVAEAGVRVESLSVSGKGYSFSGGTVQAGAATLNEAVTLTDGATLKQGEVFTVSQRDATDVAKLGPLKMGGYEGQEAVAYLHGMAKEGLTRLDNTVIDIAKGAVLELKDLMLSETCRITDDPATVAMENVTIAVSEANAIMGAVSTLDIGTALTETGSGVSFTLEELTPVVSLFSSALDMVNVTGTSLTIDLSGFAASLDEAWQANQYVAISFGQTLDSLAHFDTTSLQVTATYNGESYAVFVNKDAQASASTLYIATSADAIPEPTSATLSLLALSMLAARRRRK